VIRAYTLSASHRATVDFIWHGNSHLGDCDAIILPEGSLRVIPALRRIANFSPVMMRIKDSGQRWIRSGYMQRVSDSV